VVAFFYNPLIEFTIYIDKTVSRPHSDGRDLKIVLHLIAAAFFDKKF